MCYERACVCFNIGAMYSQMGNNEPRNTDEGLRRACSYFEVFKVFIRVCSFSWPMNGLVLTTIPNVNSSHLPRTLQVLFSTFVTMLSQSSGLRLHWTYRLRLSQCSSNSCWLNLRNAIGKRLHLVMSGWRHMGLQWITDSNQKELRRTW
jgi:hypothetical protein